MDPIKSPLRIQGPRPGSQIPATPSVPTGIAIKDREAESESSLGPPVGPKRTVSTPPLLALEPQGGQRPLFDEGKLDVAAPAGEGSSAEASHLTSAKALSDFALNGNRYGRTEVTYRTGRAVVFSQKTKLTSNVPYLDTIGLYNNRPNEPTADGNITNDPYDDNYQVNCFGYVFLSKSIPGLPENTWIGLKSPATDDTDALAVLLREFFVPVRSCQGLQKMINAGDADGVKGSFNDLLGQAKPGDVVVFYGNEGSRRVPRHAGILAPIPPGIDRASSWGPLWIRSKIEEGKVIETPIQKMLMLYYDTDEIDVFRKSE